MAIVGDERGEIGYCDVVGHGGRGGGREGNQFFLHEIRPQHELRLTLRSGTKLVLSTSGVNPIALC
jgi:hypothetical protein